MAVFFPSRRALAALVCGAACLAWGIAVAASADVLGSGGVKVQTRSLPPFSGIALSLPAQVEVRTGPAENVSIETDENLLPLVETAVVRGALQIRPVQRGQGLRPTVLKIVVTARRLDSLALAGAGTITAASLHAPQLAVQLAGTGSIMLPRLAGDSLEAAITGSGRIAVDGAASVLSAGIKGAGRLDAAGLATKTANISVVGAGEARVHADAALNASVVGSGRVLYEGHPQVSSSSIGSGTVAAAR